MTSRAATLALVGFLVAGSPAAAQELAVIVHQDRDVALGVEDVARIYLKQRRFWSDGTRIVPVNRDSASAERAGFIRLVFGSAASRLVTYWNRQYFKGVLPPATLASDEAVRRFVAGERRAIGYIRPDRVDDSVRVVLHLGVP